MLRKVDRSRGEVQLLLDLAAGKESCLRIDPWLSVNPRRFLELARRHQVDALCHWQARVLQDDGKLPALYRDHVEPELNRAYCHHSLRNQALAGDLAHLERHLARHGVEVLVFKGPWLAWNGYPDPGTRPIDDIDLGIREPDYRACLASLEAAGYRPGQVVPPTAEEAMRRAHFRGQLSFHASGRRRVELHLRMVNVGPPEPEHVSVWRDRVPLTRGSRTLFAPAFTDFLMHLALHANQHGFGVLRLLFDIRFLLAARAGEPSENGIVARAEDLRCKAAVYHSLALAAEMAGASVAPDLLRSLRPGPVRRSVYSTLWSLPRVRRLAADQRANAVEAPRLYLLEMGSLRSKIGYLRALSREAGGFTRLVRRAIAVRR